MMSAGRWRKSRTRGAGRRDSAAALCNWKQNPLSAEAAGRSAHGAKLGQRPLA